MEQVLQSVKLVTVAESIRRLYPRLNYDHRSLLPEQDTAYATKMTEEFRRGYACFKFAVAAVLQPRSICEIGVGSGIAASAFFAAAPHTHYVGVDNLYDERVCNYPFTTHLRERWEQEQRSFEFCIVEDSMDMEALPEPGKFDLVHVDGCHLQDYAYHDTLLALKSKSPWVLIDDCRDSQVTLGVMQALFMTQPGSVEWAYFEDTWTGNILISREKPHEYGEEKVGKAVEEDIPDVRDEMLTLKEIKEMQ